MVYLINNNGRVATFFDEHSVVENGFTLDQALRVSEENFEAVHGQSYINDQNIICLGVDPRLAKQIKIQAAKSFLASTDYVVIKIAEGVADKSEYEDVLLKRKQTRQELQELEGVN